MHIYFSGIGGTAIGPLALIARQAGYEVSGSDAKDSQYIHYLRGHGMKNIHIGQSRVEIAKVHEAQPIDWFVYSSALESTHSELAFCHQNNIKATKRDELINEILEDKNLKMVAIAGTHGKTTTTAMVIWLFKELGAPISYSVGAKIAFGDMGQYDPKSKYFVYECDEFDRNFLAFRPHISAITGLGWDHHEIFPTQEDYYDAFNQFVKQSNQVILWHADAKKLGLSNKRPGCFVEETDNPQIEQITLPGIYNRQDARLAVTMLSKLTNTSTEDLIKLVNRFPGVSRRFEKITDNLYSDYAHTPEKIIGAMNVALETAQKSGQKIIVIYEPLTNRRMHYTKEQHKNIFDGVDELYWVPSYLAREDPNQSVLSPTELIEYLDEPAQAVAKPAKLDSDLKHAIQEHLKNDALVVGLSGGGGGSLDEWLRDKFAKKH